MSTQFGAAPPAGRLRGMAAGGCVVFRGVPFAAPPVGPLRFQPAQPADPWDGERDATRHGPIAPQMPADLQHSMGSYDPPQGEDCLTLTIWTPAVDAGRRPVLFWLHGGAFVTGAGSLDWYDGARLAESGDVVVVHANYRLGALGWLHWPGVAAGNMALTDQAMALRWVHANIAAFGGDPAQVTLGGQSAGASCAGRLMLDPGLRPLVRRLFLQSGGFGREPGAPADTAPATLAFLKALGCDPAGPDVAGQLRAAPVDAILRAEASANAAFRLLHERQQPWRPLLDHPATVDGLLEKIAASLAGKDLLLGVTEHEAHAFVGGPIPVDMADDALAASFARLDADPTLLARYRACLPGATPAQIMAEWMSDRVFTAAGLFLAERAAALGAEVHAYMFDWAPPGSPVAGALPGHSLRVRDVARMDRRADAVRRRAGRHGSAHHRAATRRGELHAHWNAR